MANKKLKRITVTLFQQRHIRPDWYFDFDSAPFQRFCTTTTREMRKLGVALEYVRNPDVIIPVNSYADLLNAIKVSSPEDGHSNRCVGHIIDTSPNLDILEDIGSAVRRVAFAPETVIPSNEFRKVCHNCGCGC